MRRWARRIGTLLVVGGVGLIAWAGIVWAWQDPFTSVYTRWQQHKLAQQYERVYDAYRPLAQRSSLAAIRRELRTEARRYRRETHAGEAIGRIRIPRLHVDMVLVDGTDHDSLTKGPGRDLRSYMPGQGELVYVAGHRTTYLAPFSHIDSLRKGDPVTIEVPYGTFTYRVTGHRIVSSTDMSVLESRGHEVLELQACHPRFFATHRYIAYAKLTAVRPRGAEHDTAVQAATLAAAVRS